MGPKSNEKCPYKRGAGGVLRETRKETQTHREGGVKTEAAIGRRQFLPPRFFFKD